MVFAVIIIVVILVTQRFTFHPFNFNFQYTLVIYHCVSWLKFGL